MEQEHQYQREQKYCATCGAQIDKQAEICPKCGVRQPNTSSGGGIKNERWLITLLLCIFAGYLGVHRFYTGHIAIGVIQLLTLGGCGIWVFIDFLILVTNNFKDSEGNRITYS